jgi:hypothetical protein
VYRKGIYVEHKGKKPEEKKDDSKTQNDSGTSDNNPGTSTAPDPHIAIEDSIQKILPKIDTVSEKPEKHHRHHSSPEISIGKKGKTYNSKVDHDQHSEKKSQKNSYKKKTKGKHQHVHKKKHKVHAKSKTQIGWLGKLVYGLGWLADILLLIFGYAVKYLPMETTGEWYFVTAILILSLFFALLALAISPLARKYDSRHTNLIDEGVANAKVVLGIGLIFLLISGAVIGIIALLAML